MAGKRKEKKKVKPLYQIHNSKWKKKMKKKKRTYYWADLFFLIYAEITRRNNKKSTLYEQLIHQMQTDFYISWHHESSRPVIYAEIIRRNNKIYFIYTTLSEQFYISIYHANLQKVNNLSRTGQNGRAIILNFFWWKRTFCKEKCDYICDAKKSRKQEKIEPLTDTN